MYTAAFRVLEILSSSKEPVTGDDISLKLSISRSAVWKHIQKLTEIGYEISTSHEGYLLKQRTDIHLPYEVHKKLRTGFIGRQMRYFEKTPSTISTAKEILQNENVERIHGMVVIAEEQTGGMGRLGRSWLSPSGGIWVTIVLNPAIPVERLFMVTMAGAIAVARSIRREYDLGALIKWPNDIFIGDKKVAGLLLEIGADEGVVNYCLLGIGIDVNIPVNKLEEVLIDGVTSISSELEHDVDRAALLARVLKEFESRYLLLEEEEYDAIIREWKSLSCTLDHRVKILTLKNTFEGDAFDIDESGALMIRKDNGRVEHVISGDCLNT